MSRLIFTKAVASLLTDLGYDKDSAAVAVCFSDIGNPAAQPVCAT